MDDILKKELTKHYQGRVRNFVKMPEWLSSSRGKFLLTEQMDSTAF